MLFEQCSGRMFQLLSWVGYTLEFPKQLASRIGQDPGWSRHVMYRAVREGYLEVYRKETPGRVITSLRITDKGLEYIAVRSPEAYLTLLARAQEVPRSAHTGPDRILRYHSFASAMVMAHNAGAAVLPEDKPPLTLGEYERHAVPADPQACYFYSTAEIRTAIQEYAPDIAAKGSRIAGALVHGGDCFCIYDAGRSRVFWMRATEENFAGTVQSLLNLRGFRIRTLRQAVIGDRMSVAAKLCRKSSYRGTRYFVPSNFFNNCYFLPNSRDGDRQMRAMWDAGAAAVYERRALRGCRPPDEPTREYDAVDCAEGRPVILNFLCDLLAVPGINFAPAGFDDPPIILCFDHQADVLRQLVGSLAEVRGIGGTEPDG